MKDHKVLGTSLALDTDNRSDGGDGDDDEDEN